MPLAGWWAGHFAVPNHHADCRSQYQQERCHSRNNWIASRPAPDAHRRRDGTRDDVAAFEPAFEVFGQIAGGAITRARFALQTFRADRFQIAVQRWHKRAQFRRRLFARLLDHRQRVLAQKWRTTGQKIEQDRAQTVDIRRRRKFAPADPFACSGAM